jgi:predicted nucleic acid-binding protein
LYLDASGLVKAYLAETGSPEVAAAAAVATAVATNIVGYAETRGALARALREGRIDAARHAATVILFDADWPAFAVVEADGTLVRDAARLIDRHVAHALRAFDAIHLASALLFAGGQPATVTFACWDLRLWRAARDEGFVMLPATEPV